MNQDSADAGASLVALSATDSSDCDREQIHLLGAIQPHGFALVTGSDWHVSRVSANIEGWMERHADDLLGRPLDELLRREAVHTIRNRVTALRSADSVEHAFGISLRDDGVLFDLAIHLSGGEIVIECEPTETIDATVVTPLGAMIARLQRTQGFADLCREAVRQMRTLIGFDRVMLYRFQPDGSGEVITESIGPGLEPFLGLRYPAFDIPRQARALYERNLVRLIADVDAAPVAVTPGLDPNGQALDLSLSGLRAVSSVHLEYLRNMAVGASMSVSILRQGKLWGLLACHHGMRRYVGLARRTAAALFGQVVSLLLESREREAEAEYEVRARQLHDQLMAAVAADSSALDNVLDLLGTMTELIPCSGIGIWTDERLTLKGTTPTREECLELVQFLNRTTASRAYACHDLGRVHAPARAFVDRAAGLLAIPISRSPRDYIMFFRGEVARSVTWAGEPAKALTFGPQGSRFTPRKSFDAWREVVRGQADPWTAAELRAAESLRVTLLEVMLRVAAHAERERRAALERQSVLIGDLNDRVRNILGVLHGVVSQSRGGAKSLNDYVAVLDGRVQTMARAHDQTSGRYWEGGALHALFEVESAASVVATADRVRCDGPDLRLQPHAFATLALVVHELLTNAVKHGALRKQSGHVEVTWACDALGRLVIEWVEKGGGLVLPPKRRGFGTTLIERSIPHELDGAANIVYKPSGLLVRLLIPAQFISNGAIALRPSDLGTSDEPVRISGDVLLVEDNLIIALDAEEMLARLGADRVHLASCVRDARQVMEAVRPTLAVLDINLGNETSFAVADHLLSLGVPYFFATGYGDQITLSAKHQQAPLVRKPYSLEMLAAAIARLHRPPLVRLMDGK